MTFGGQHQNSRISNQSGFTLVEAMILAAVISVIVVTFSSYMFQRAKQLEQSNIRKNFSQVQNSIRNAAGQTESMVYTEELQFETLATPTLTPTPTVAPTPTVGPAILAWNEPSYNYGDREVGSIQNRWFTITNTGSGSSGVCTGVTIGGNDPAEFNGPGGGTCLSSGAAAGGTCTVRMSTNPTSTGVKTATFTLACPNGTAITTANGIRVNGTPVGSSTPTPTPYADGEYCTTNPLFVTTLPDCNLCATFPATGTCANAFCSGLGGGPILTCNCQSASPYGVACGLNPPPSCGSCLNN